MRKLRGAAKAIEGLLERDERAVTVPKRTSVRGQPHKLAYINDEEAALLRSRGGGVDRDGGQIMHRGVPAYVDDSGGGSSNAGPDGGGQGHNASNDSNTSNSGGGGDSYAGGAAAPAADPAAADRKKRLDAGEYIPSETPYATPAPFYAPMPSGLGGPPPGTASPFAGFGAALGAPPVMQPYALNPAPARPTMDTFAPLPPAPMPMPTPRADQTPGYFEYLRLLRGY